MTSSTGVFIVFIFVTLYDSLSATCPTKFSLKSMPKIAGEQFEETASIHNIKSALGCFSHCFSHSCKSYGIDLVNMKCYLYDFHVWSGGEIVQGTNLTYHWMLQKTCPESYTFVASLHFCYKFYSNSSRWSLAMKNCIQDGGLLAMVDTDAKLNIVNQLSDKFVFVGSTDKIEEGRWKWLNGADIDKWTQKPKRRCLTVEPYGGFANKYCYNNYPFACEIPIGVQSTGVDNII